MGLGNAWYILIQMKPQQITITLLYLYTIHKILCSVRGESLRPLAPVGVIKLIIKVNNASGFSSINIELVRAVNTQ